MPYVEVESFKSTLEMAGESFADDDIELCLDAASALVESYCGRHFTRTEEPTARFYQAHNVAYWEDYHYFTNRSEVWIDDLVELVSLESSESPGDEWPTLWTAGYALEPWNAPADGRPYTTIAVQPGSSLFPRWHGGVKVTGVFGWPEVPVQVRLASSLLASRLLRRARDAPFGVIAFGGEDGGGLPLRQTDPDVAQLLAPLVKF